MEEHSNRKHTPYKFNGKELDEETGLYYYGARYYDAQTSIWLSVDPLADSAASWTPYHFVKNNPINRIDPDGRTDYELNSTGEVVNVLENKESDNIYMVGDNGERIDGRSISFDYGTITAVRSPTIKEKTKTGDIKENTLTIFEVNGDENATQIFEFFSKS